MSKLIGSRIGRREQLSQQERLIEQRKREIETKLNLLTEKDVKDIKSAENSVEEDIKESNESINTNSNNSNESECEVKPLIVNKFKNDGSFFAQFLQMQKCNQNNDQKCGQNVQSIESNDSIELNTSNETTDSKPSLKGIKMVLKAPQNTENTSKLRIVSSVDDSNVVFCDDDNEDIVKVSPPEDKDIQLAIEKTAISVTMNGINAEETMRQSKANEVLYSWLNDKQSISYKYFEKRVSELAEAKIRAQNEGLLGSQCAETSTSGGIKRQRKSRWGDEKVEVKQDPVLVQYAIQVFGNTDLNADQWKQLEDQRKMKMIFEMLKKKQKSDEMLAKAGKVRYDYDSDEDTTDGTWEHKRRRQEMTQTHIWAEDLTEKAQGKHHIGDFMPPEELEKFMQKWESFKEGTPWTESDYKDLKLQEDNVGFQMLKKLGWVEGQGLGHEGTGIADPVNRSVGGVNNAGLGQIRPDELKEGDDEYEAYRKRMMLAYRFRPNPLCLIVYDPELVCGPNMLYRPF